jgi:hypothetical protein
MEFFIIIWKFYLWLGVVTTLASGITFFLVSLEFITETILYIFKNKKSEYVNVCGCNKKYMMFGILITILLGVLLCILLPYLMYVSPIILPLCFFMDRRISK